jgi:hypothetical protein
LVQARERIGILEMSSTLVQDQVSTLEDMMEMALTPMDLTSDDSDYVDVDDRGVIMVEDSEDERDQENIPPPILPCQDTPHPAPVCQEHYPIYTFFFVFPLISFFNPHSFIMTIMILFIPIFYSLTTCLYM